MLGTDNCVLKSGDVIPESGGICISGAVLPITPIEADLGYDSTLPVSSVSSDSSSSFHQV